MYKKLIGVFVFATLVVSCIIGCQSGDSSSPVAPAVSVQAPAGGPAGGASVRLAFQLDPVAPELNPDATDESGVAPTIRAAASTTAQVLVKLVTVQLGVATQPTTVLEGVFTPDVNNRITAVFNSVPVQTTVAQVHVVSGTIAGLTDFHGAGDLAPGANTLVVNGSGSKMLSDLAAHMILRIANTPNWFARAPGSLATRVRLALSGINRAATTAYQDAETIILAQVLGLSSTGTTGTGTSTGTTTGGRIAGSVKVDEGADTKLVVGARVYVEQHPSIQTTSDANGQFTLEGVPEGAANVIAERGSAGAMFRMRSPEVQVLRGILAALGEIKIVSAQNSISGRVINTSNQSGVSDAVVNCWGQISTSDYSGRYTVFNMPQGTWPVSFTRAGFITKTVQISFGAGQSTSFDVGLEPVAVNTGTSTATATQTGTITNQPPAVAIIAPANGSTVHVNDNVTVVANAVDNDGQVTSVQFLINGSVTGSDNTAPYSDSWVTTQPGTYTITVLAADNNGAVQVSPPVTVIVQASTGTNTTTGTATTNATPTVSLVLPTNGSVYSNGQSVAIVANAADSDGSITLVQFMANGALIGSATSAPYSFNWGSAGVGTHTLTAIAFDDKGAAANSTGVTVTVNPAAPAIPMGVSAAAGDGSVTLSWTAVSGATSYNVYWSATPGVTTGNGTKLTGVANPYAHTGRTNGTTLYYVVTAFGPGGESGASSQVSATPQVGIPTAPTGLAVTATDAATILTWNAVSGATSYNVYWSTAAGVTTANGTKITGVTSPYTHSGRTNGTRYYYIVTAMNAGGESGPAGEASALPVSTSQWPVQFGTSQVDFCSFSAVDAVGNVFVTGMTGGALPGFTSLGGYDVFLAKFDSRGNRLWLRQWGSAAYDEPKGIGLDAVGNVYVSGRCEGAFDGQSVIGGSDRFVTKFDTNGTRLWTKVFGTPDNDGDYGMAVDASGNSYVSGGTTGTIPGETRVGGVEDLILAKLDSNGNVLWIRQWGSTANDYSQGCAVDRYGNCYVAGCINVNGGGTVTVDGVTSVGATDVSVTKVSPSGSRVWTKILGTPGHDAPYQIAVDRSDNPVVIINVQGAFQGQPYSGAADILVLKLNSSGDVLWARATGSTNDDIGDGISVDASNNVLISGYTKGTLPGCQSSGGDDYWSAKYDASGNLLWLKQGGTTAGDYWGSNAVDGAGVTVAVGHPTGSFPGYTNAGSNDALLTAYDSSGSLFSGSLTGVTNVAGTIVATPSWNLAVASGTFGPRWFHRSLNFNNKLWVLGGGIPTNSYTSEVWSSADGANWTQVVATASWSGRGAFASCVFDGKMWVIAGSGSGGRTNDVWYSSDGSTWTQATANAGFPTRYDCVATVFNNKMWLTAGYNGSRLNDVWSSTDGVTWTQVTAGAAWGGRTNPVFVAHNNALWIMAGGTGSGPYGDVWKSTDGATWTQVKASAEFGTRDCPEGTVYNGKMYVSCGIRTGPIWLADLWSSSDGLTWSAEQFPSIPGRYAFGLEVFNGRIFLTGGVQSSGFADVWWYGTN